MNEGIHAMSERSIFLAALDIADSAQRSASRPGRPIGPGFTPGPGC